ncbi:XdhC family protein [bacterium]|nr:XdhC family protein [bacterium]
MKEIYQIIVENINNNIEFVVVTIVDSSDSTPRKSGARMVVNLDRTISGTIGGGVLEHTAINDAINLFNDGENVLRGYNIGDEKADRVDDAHLGAICGGRVTLYFEIFKRKDVVYIFGGGHVGQKLAALLDVVEFPYYIVDNREEFASKKLFPNARDIFNIEYDDIDQLPVDQRSYCVIITHGHKFDAICVEKLLDSPAKYIGMIGSLNKVRCNLKVLAMKDVKIDNRLYSPIGLCVTDGTPANLAVSILSEILAVQSGKSEIIHMRDKFINKFKDDSEINEILKEGGLI